MCGRFVQAQPASAYAAYFGADTVKTESLDASYNVAPTDPVYAVAEHDGERQLGTFRWGLVPYWAKDRKIAARNINARMETVATKPAFRDSFSSKRCLVPADGFYEWETLAKGKLPHFIHREDGGPLGLAGLWASWRDRESGERLRTCTILTQPPDEVVSRVHDRMPVILPREAWSTWLDPQVDDVEALYEMLAKAKAGRLEMYPVSTLVNKVANNFPELIGPLEESAVRKARGELPG